MGFSYLVMTRDNDGDYWQIMFHTLWALDIEQFAIVVNI